ncbi:MAG: outer membrane lipoprotein carrier protein LolA [Dethiobacter sp.]|jgi:outer membrane lipoprotein-sorting protein|nr:outer membrane lipoprotein carrier protein LolA [Dethiobacter sp.]
MKKLICLILVVFLFLAAGCGRKGSVPGDSNPKDIIPEPKTPVVVEKEISLDEIVSNIKQLGETLVSFKGVLEISVDFNGFSEAQQYKLWYSGDSRYRMEWETAAEGMTITVFDGDNLWNYITEGNLAYVMSADIEFQQSETFFQDLFAYLQDPEEYYSFSYQGMDKVDGRQAYILEITSKSYDFDEALLTWWVDAKTWFPFKAETEIGGMTTTVLYLDFVLNPALNDEVFTFIAPDGAQVIDMNDLLFR